MGGRLVPSTTRRSTGSRPSGGASARPSAIDHNRGLRTQAEIDALQRAKERLDPLALYREPVRITGVRIRIAPWLFRLPGFRRFRGYATRRNIWLKRPALDERLVAHELCHVWQLQHEPLRVWLSYARPSTFSPDRRAYRANRYEVEARLAADSVRAVGVPRRAVG